MTIFLVDIDCFFAAVETVLNPHLKGKPVCVGGLRSDRGVVVCPNYEARRYGVRSAMPLRIAAKLLPDNAVFLRGNYRRYSEYSKRVMEILETFTPDVAQVSLDEAFLDVTGCLHFWNGKARRMAHAIKERILREVALTVSIGIASTRVCAKVAAELGKPDGLVLVDPGTEKAFLAPLPIERLPGIGTKTAAKLHQEGIQTLGQLAASPVERLQQCLGVVGLHLHEMANGAPTKPRRSRGESGQADAESRPAFFDQGEKSISRNTTLSRDTSDPEILSSTLYALTERCCKTLREEGWYARTLTVKIRFSDFSTHQKQCTLRRATANEEGFFPLVHQLLQELWTDDRKVRLVGVRVSNFQSEEHQLDLPLSKATAYPDLHRRIDALQEKYGHESIQRGITAGLSLTRRPTTKGLKDSEEKISNPPEGTPSAQAPRSK